MRSARARGFSRAAQERLANQAQTLVRAQYLRNTLGLALVYGIRSVPRIDDPAFVSRLVLDMRTNVNDRISSLRVLTLMTDAGDMEPELNRVKELAGKYTEAQNKLSAQFAKEADVPERLATLRNPDEFLRLLEEKNV